MLKKLIKFVIFGISAASLSFSQSTEGTISLAVLNFSARNMDQNDAVTLSDRFRFELAKINTYSVMERTQMDLILQEQNFQRSESCEQQCAIEAGQLAAVQKIITGAITRFGRLYTVNIKMIDVETGKIEAQASHDCECSKEKLLKVIMKDAAYKISGCTPVVLKQNFSTVQILTDLPGASLTIDGDSTEKKTPVSIDSLITGKHIIIASLGSLHAEKEFKLSLSKPKTLKLDLRKSGSLLSVITNPSDVEIFVNRNISKRFSSGIISPAVIKETSKSDVTLNFFKTGFNDTSITVKLNQNRPEILKIDLKQLDSEHSMNQIHVVSQRKQSKIGLFLSIPSFGLCCGAAYLYYRSTEFYETAAEYKQCLESSVIKDGPYYDDLVIKNRNAADKGNLNRTGSMILGGVGLTGALTGIILYF